MFRSCYFCTTEPSFALNLHTLCAYVHNHLCIFSHSSLKWSPLFELFSYCLCYYLRVQLRILNLFYIYINSLTYNISDVHSKLVNLRPPLTNYNTWTRCVNNNVYLVSNSFYIYPWYTC